MIVILGVILNTSGLSKYGVPENPITSVIVPELFHSVTTLLSLISSSATWWTSSINIAKFGILPIVSLNSFATLLTKSSVSKSILICSFSILTLSKITFSAFVNNITPNISLYGWYWAILATLGFFILLLFFSVLTASNISNFNVFLRLLAIGSGKIQVTSKSLIFFKLGKIELFNPDGAKTIKLCANALL